MYKNIIFDLDGTLINSDAGIVNSLNYALAAFGLEQKSYDELKQYIGPPLLDTFTTAFGLGEERGDAALKKYREYYSQKGIFEAAPYPGVREMLASLHAAGHGIFLGTSKVVEYAGQTLEHFGLKQYFTFVGGASMDGERRGKAEVLRHVLGEHPLTPDDTIMVGDTVYDVEGAKDVGLSTAAVLWGYGSRWSLEKAGAEYFFDDVASLEAWLLHK